MGAYTTAWIVILGAAAGGGGVLYWLLRNLSNSLIRKVIVAIAVAFFIVPAPLPEYPEQLAPAFVVCIFEALFQIDGSPGASLRILLVSMALAAGLVLAAHYALQRFLPGSAKSASTGE